MQQADTPDFSESPSTSKPTPSLIDYLDAIARRIRTIVKITAATALISLVWSLLLPNIYTARTMVLPGQEDRNLMSAMMNQLGGLATLAGVSGGSFGGPNTSELYVSMLKSEAVKDPIIDRFQLMKRYEKSFRSDVYAILDSNASVLLGKKDGIITVTYSDKDPKFAAAMANAYVEELGLLAVRLNVAGAGQNRSFLEDRLATSKADLVRAEESLKDFQSKNKTVSVTAQAEATIKGVAELRAQLAAQEVQLATYRRQFTDASQEVKTLAAAVDNLRGQIAKLEGVGGDSAIPSVGSAATIGQQYVRLMREFKIQESLVELLTKQYEMAKLSEAKDIAPFQVIQKAKVPERKSRPHRLSIVLMTMFTACFLSVVGIFLNEYYRNLPEQETEKWRDIARRLYFWKRQRM